MTPEEIVKRLRRGEREGVDGWWSTMADAADLIEQQAKALEEAEKALSSILHVATTPAKGEKHNQLYGVPDSHLFELVWARDEEQDYPCVTAGQIRRATAALATIRAARREKDDG